MYREKKYGGVVYQIDELDIAKLDNKEKYNPNHAREENSYIRCEKQVLRCGDKESPLAVSTYVAMEQEPPKPNCERKPNREYKELILGGAQHWHLPEQYAKFLEHIETLH